MGARLVDLTIVVGRGSTCGLENYKLITIVLCGLSLAKTLIATLVACVVQI